MRVGLLTSKGQCCDKLDKKKRTSQFVKNQLTNECGTLQHQRRSCESMGAIFVRAGDSKNCWS